MALGWAAAGRGGGGVAAAQAAHRRGVAGRGRVRAGLPGADLSDAVLGFTALELAQTLRYLPDLVVVLALLAAVGFCAPNRPAVRAGSTPRRDAPRWWPGLAVLFVASSLYSTATFLTSWQDNPAKAYLQNATRGLAAAKRPRLRRCWIRRSIRWCCNGWPARRIWPATCSP